jgi:serine/arginine repetitive matrix protein 2
MANIDEEAAGLSDLTGKASGNAGLVGAVVESLSTEVVAEPPVVNAAKDPEPHPQLTMLDSSSSTRSPFSNVPSGSSNLGSANAHPKRFSAVNINKKFLEKTSSGSGTSQTSSASVSTKSGGPVGE